MLLNVSLRRLVLALKERNKKREAEVGVASKADLSKDEDSASEETRELEVSLTCVVCTNFIIFTDWFTERYWSQYGCGLAQYCIRVVLW